jgi:hypothetical protein
MFFMFPTSFCLRLLKACLSLTIILISISFLSCSKDDDTGQLLNDPSLNLSDGKIFPDSWYYWQNQSKHEFFWSPKETSSRDFYLAIATDSLDAVNFSYFNQAVFTPLPKGKQLILRARIKAENMAGEGASIAIRCDGPNGMVAFSSSQDNTKIDGSFEWKEFSVVLDKVPDETNAIQVFLVYLPSTTGKVYFDDVTLTYNK